MATERPWTGIRKYKHCIGTAFCFWHFIPFFNQNTDWDYMGGFNGAWASFLLQIRDWIDITHCLGRKEKRPFCITRLIERSILERDICFLHYLDWCNCDGDYVNLLV
jgi:hypothetical protein